MLNGIYFRKESDLTFILTEMEALCYMTSPGMAVLAFRSPSDTAMVNQGTARVFREALWVTGDCKFRVLEPRFLTS